MSSLFHVHSTAASLTCFVSVMVGDDGAVRPNAVLGHCVAVLDLLPALSFVDRAFV